jgi:hypothetical protein
MEAGDGRSAQTHEETFAKANECIRMTAEQYDFSESVPFLCECSDVTCVESVRLSLTNYRKARAGGGAFILLPGHEDPHLQRIVAHGDGYVLVERFS